MAKRNTLRQEYYKETRNYWKTLNKEAIPTIEYCKWLENELLTEREEVKNNVDLHNVSKQRELLLAYSNHLNTYKGMEEIRFDFMMQDFLDKSQL